MDFHLNPFNIISYDVFTTVKSIYYQMKISNTTNVTSYLLISKKILRKKLSKVKMIGVIKIPN